MYDTVMEPRNTTAAGMPGLEVECFLDRLMTVSLSDWYSAATAPDALDLDDAIRALTRAVATAEMLFPAWLVRDQVATACCRFESPEGRRVRPEARAHDVTLGTERAAVALLVRSSLAAEEFSALYGGFARLWPAERQGSAS
jgi:hypothetical protein